MREVCLVNRGDNIKKLNHIMNVSKSAVIEKERLLNNQYILLEKGEDDITIVRNYNPYHLINNKQKLSGIDVYTMGYESIQGDCREDISVIRRIEGVRYIVKPMEKIDEIATRLGVDKQVIIDNNHLKTEKLFVGQVLVI